MQPLNAVLVTMKTAEITPGEPILRNKERSTRFKMALSSKDPYLSTCLLRRTLEFQTGIIHRLSHTLVAIIIGPARLALSSSSSLFTAQANS